MIPSTPPYSNPTTRRTTPGLGLYWGDHGIRDSLEYNCRHQLLVLHSAPSLELEGCP